MSRISQRRRIDFLSEPAVGCPFGVVMLHFVHWEDRNWLSVDVFKDMKGLDVLDHRRLYRLASVVVVTLVTLQLTVGAHL
jgi:hypothetical protein